MRARTARELRPPRRRHDRRTIIRITAAGAAIVLVAAVAVAVALRGPSGGDPGPSGYLGVFTPGAPRSYASVQAFAAATGVRPGVVVYYSGWQEPFQRGFAVAAARHHAIPLVQIDPTRISIKAIAAGHYDGYLRSYATAIRAFGGRVILSFGHEMNAWWYGWGYRHVSPAVFVAAWRHIVTVFRHQGATNVIWLWTVNVIDHHAHILDPDPWWPGSSYVTWVGLDGYYSKPSLTFAPLFGPTIKAVRRLTLDPVLISETAAPVSTAQPAKITNLFAGVRAYGLLGFVWFNAPGHQDWRMAGPTSFAAFRRGAKTYRPPGS